mgnify:CR=1 FL=1
MPAPTAAPAETEVPERSLGDVKVPYEVLKIIPEESAEHYKLAPITVTDGVLEVGMVDPDNMQGIDALNFISGKKAKALRLSDLF